MASVTTTAAAAAAAAAPATVRLDLPITGMTCGACAARVEKGLNRLDGVTATVNFATRKAAVDYDPALATPAAVAAQVAGLGYGCELPGPATGPGPGAGAAGSDAGPAGTDADGDGEGGAESAEVADLRRRVMASLVLAGPVVLLSMVPALQFDEWMWLGFALASPVALWAAWPIHRAALVNLRHGAATMDTLVSVGVTAAYAWSVYALFWGEAGMPGMTHDFRWTAGSPDDAGSRIYLEVAAAVPLFILGGRYLEARATHRAGSAIRSLLALGAKDVAVLSADGTERRAPVGELAVGDRFVVRPGEKVATDGVVVEGRSAVDRSLVTGESTPVDVGPGDEVTGATVNADGRLVVEARRVGADTALARMARLVEQAQTGKAPVQRLADRVAGVFVPAVILFAAGTLGFRIGAGEGLAAAFAPAVAVLIVACPCALGLATPVALMVGTGRGAQLGILVKGPEVLEQTRRIDTVLLDKTGTVTTGSMTLVDVVAGPGADRDEALRLAGALESASEHPIARAIASAAESLATRAVAVTPPGAAAAPATPAPRAIPANPGAPAAAAAPGARAAAAAPGRRGSFHLTLSAPDPAAAAEVADFVNHAGLGVEGRVGGRAVVVGRPQLLADRGLDAAGEVADARDRAEADGHTAVLVGWDGAARAVLAVADTPKPTSAAAVAELRRLGMHPVLLTGDNARTARAVAAEVGIDDVEAEVLPADKVAAVRRRQEAGHVVAMVGDGVNDAAALAQADIGIAMGTGTDAAIEASDLTVVRGDLRLAAGAVRLARRTLATIKGNLFWAFAYNVAAIPVAAAGLLNPMLAGAAMAASSLFVVGNSLRLRRFTP